MSNPQPNLCFSCKRELEQTFVFVPQGASPDDYMISEAVWVSPIGREIGFCNRCYDRGRFDGLEPDEVSALHWSFGRCDAKDPPEIIEKKIARLLMAVEGLPCGEVFVALAYAYHLAGRKTEAHIWATKAVSWATKFPGRELAEGILKQ
jgi:hypothetical protein